MRPFSISFRLLFRIFQAVDRRNATTLTDLQHKPTNKSNCVKQHYINGQLRFPESEITFFENISIDEAIIDFVV